jgi:putative hydrolase of the HAD superfamily
MKIVFDFGGVMLRWQPLEFLPRLLPRRATTPETTLGWARAIFQGFGGDWGEFDRGVIEADALAQRIAARTGLSVQEARHLIEAIPAELEPLPDSVALLRRLHEAGRELYFLSNMPEPYARHIEATHDFLAMFRRGIYSARVRMIKPDPAIFEHARALFGAEAAPLVFIDDVAKNIEAARASGWQAIHFVNAGQCEAELRSLGLIG